MSRTQSDRPTTILPPDDVVNFGRRRRGGGSVGMSMPAGTGLVTRLVMGGFRIMFLGGSIQDHCPAGNDGSVVHVLAANPWNGDGRRIRWRRFDGSLIGLRQHDNRSLVVGDAQVIGPRHGGGLGHGK